MTVEAWIALAALAVTIGSGLAAYIASSAAVKVHLSYLREKIDETKRSVRAAHWRLDEIQAPPAPTVDR